jgi:hypothetical protein
LCDENRLLHSGGWEHFNRPSGSHIDCGLAAKESTGPSIVEFPAFAPPSTTTECRLMFTVRWSAAQSTSPRQPVRLERLVNGTWVDITRWPLQAPYNELRSGAFSGGLATPRTLRSFSFGVGGRYGAATERVRFAYDAGAPERFELLDAVVGCRTGAILP